MSVNVEDPTIGTHFIQFAGNQFLNCKNNSIFAS